MYMASTGRIHGAAAMITWLSTKSPAGILDQPAIDRLDERRRATKREIHTPSFALAETDAKYFPQIPPACLNALKLLHHEKMTFAEITQQTGWPTGTVRSRIHRAREIIRRLRAADQPPETMQKPTWGAGTAG
jgi:DNA-directed RNA polymerase specialized sigma24 family protein